MTDYWMQQGLKPITKAIEKMRFSNERHLYMWVRMLMVNSATVELLQLLSDQSTPERLSLHIGAYLSLVMAEKAELNKAILTRTRNLFSEMRKPAWQVRKNSLESTYSLEYIQYENGPSIPIPNRFILKSSDGKIVNKSEDGLRFTWPCNETSHLLFDGETLIMKCVYQQ